MQPSPKLFPTYILTEIIASVQFYNFSYFTHIIHIHTVQHIQQIVREITGKLE